jgi:ubiquinone/menaquinone biosynthesis C-methylase UbiE
MKERHTSRERMQWLEMDILDLQFEDESFDLVIDKGMFTATELSCGS